MLRIIKKYPNRRLYDTEQGCYITLEDIKQHVLDRIEFRVIDTRTEEDITQSTLLQIITERETSTNPIFTIEVLQNLIRFYHEKTQNMVSQYLEHAVALFAQQKEIVTHQWKSYQKLLANPFSFTSHENETKKWLREVFTNVIEDLAATEQTIAKYFAEDYIQHVDGKTLHYQDFVAHMRTQKSLMKSIKVTFEHMLVEGEKINTVHRVHGVKKNGQEIEAKVIALLQIRDRKIILCDELTHLIKGEKSDKDLSHIQSV